MDEHPDLADAKKQARDNGIKMAISNPNFELWILLHFQDQTRGEDRSEIRRKCEGHVPRYEKETPYTLMRAHYAEALRRASDLDKWHATRGTDGENPCTAVYLLTQRLIELNRDNVLRQHRKLSGA